MQIVPISFQFLDPFTADDGIRMLKKIERIARVSHRSEDRVTEDSYDKFLRSVVMTHGDLSVIEHVNVTVEVEVDRGITHEIVRHRIGAYTQESTRFVNYNKQPMRFIQPPFKSAMTDSFWEEAVEHLEETYLALLKEGEPPEIARSVLPNSLAAKLVITYNLRMWRYFLIMRTTKEAHPQMKLLTIPLVDRFKETIPILFEDILPEVRQADAMRLLR